MTLLRNRTLIAATIGHFSVDMYSGMLPLILLVLTDPLGLSYAKVGLVSMCHSLASSLGQPFFGWLGDKGVSRQIAAVGVTAIATTVGVMRFVDQYAVLLALALLAGLGSAAFHPQGAMVAGNASSEQRSSAAGIFLLGGNTGYAFGPIFGSVAFALSGKSMPEMLALLGLGQATLVFWALAPQYRFPREKPSVDSFNRTGRAPLSMIITLGLVIFLRSWVQTSAATYIPQMYKTEGSSTEEAGAVLFSVLVPLAIAGPIGGNLADKIGQRRVLVFSTGLIGPALWGLMHASGAASYILGPLLGVAIGASLPVTLVMAQNLFPRGLGFMSGVVLGFTFVAGAIGVAVIGIVPDQIGLLPTMTISAVLPVAATAAAFLLPDDRRRAARVEVSL